jgi:predicted ArsR family transcriptional regulator
MDYELRLVVEKVSVGTQKVVKRDTLKVYDITEPDSILALGLRHEEQLSLIAKVQNAVLAEQAKLIDTGHSVCPKCGHKLKKNGHTKSNFHAVFSDHKVPIQKHLCSHPECNWQNAPTTTSVFGTNIHPDLAKLQCEQGALHTYREAQSNLEKLNVHRRPVNNHNKVKQITNQVGAVLAKENLKPIAKDDCAAPAEEVIVQIDGGHLPTQEKNKRSFEALSAVVYRPESIREIDNHHREIENKSCAISAVDDELATIKTYVLNATHKQGMNQQTKVTALADGASNCWSVISSLAPHCKQLESILDWFHIGKRFQTVKNALGAGFEDSLERAKWKLWHGKVDEALKKLALLKRNVTDEKKRSKLNGLYQYIKSNKAYIVNYGERKRVNKTYTSQVAESHIESVINARHKRSGKMQWTREGAHNVLQIRAIMTNQEWDNKWQGAVLSALGIAV